MSRGTVEHTFVSGIVSKSQWLGRTLSHTHSGRIIFKSSPRTSSPTYPTMTKILIRLWAYRHTFVSWIICKERTLTSCFAWSSRILSIISWRTVENTLMVRKIWIIWRWTPYYASSCDIVCVFYTRTSVVACYHAVICGVIGEIGRWAELNTYSWTYIESVWLRGTWACSLAESVNWISESSEWTLIDTDMFDLICVISLGAEGSACVVECVAPVVSRASCVTCSIGIHAWVVDIMFVWDRRRRTLENTSPVCMLIVMRPNSTMLNTDSYGRISILTRRASSVTTLCTIDSIISRRTFRDTSSRDRISKSSPILPFRTVEHTSSSDVISIVIRWWWTSSDTDIAIVISPCILGAVCSTLAVV